MIAYSRQSLDNREIQHQAAAALAKGVITEGEYQRIKEAHPSQLYSPNIFIRIGLFLLAVLATVCGVGLSMLMVPGYESLLIFWGIISYGALELFIYRQHVYRAGVDDALLWMAGSLVFGGIALLAPSMSPTLASALALALATWGMLRYTDRLMTVIAYGALMSLIFHLLARAGNFSMAMAPFVFMAVSIGACFLFTRLSGNASLRHYRECFSLLRVTALLSFYLAVNYFVVQQINASIHGDSAPVALGWLWWTFTAIVPVAYIVWGILKKDAIFLWTGMGLVAAAVFTVRYYYHVLPAEVAMIIAGCMLIIGAYAVIRYLRIPKHGFTSAAPEEPHLLQNLPVESLILAETFKSAPAQPVGQPNGFGGGSGGGGGAGGTY